MTEHNAQSSARWAGVAIATVFVAVLVVTPFLFVGPFAVFGATSPRAILKDQPHDYLKDLVVPEFTLTSQDGEPVTASVLDGRYTVVDFIFTNCTLACPVMFSNLGPLHRELAGTPVRFLSISVDPEHDTPATLRAFADRLDLDTARWTLAASDQETLMRLIEGLRFTIYEDAKVRLETSSGASMNNIVHPTKLLLIGPDREVLGLYSGMEFDGVQELGRDLRLLLRAE